MRSAISVVFLMGLWGCGPARDETSSTSDVEEAPAPETASTDAPDVEPDHYKVELENDHVRVLRISYKAGEEGKLHSHADGVTVFVTDGAVSLTLEDGTTQERSWEAGAAAWSPAETHGGVAKTDIEGILIEVKSGAAEAVIPESNATVSDPDHHVVEFENDRVRIVRMTYPAGYATPPHDHLAGVNVMLADYQGTNTAEGGEPAEVEGSAGEVSWADRGAAHVTRNTGEEPIELVRVEIKAAS